MTPEFILEENPSWASFFRCTDFLVRGFDLAMAGGIVPLMLIFVQSCQIGDQSDSVAQIIKLVPYFAGLLLVGWVGRALTRWTQLTVLDVLGYDGVSVYEEGDKE